jgi:hypothetical protein
MEGAPKRPVAATPPAHRGDTDGHPIALIVALQVPVRTQGPRRDALTGADGLRHTALGWGVQTPRTRRRTAAPAGRLPPGD